LVTQAEIEAAVDAYLIVGIGENVPAAMLAILEAAERVRPRRDPTNAKRSRQWRAKKRADRNVARNVAGDDASNVTRLAPGIGNVTGNVAGNRNVARNGVTFARNVPADLLERLLQAANRNVQPAAGEPHAIVSLIEQGCDLDLDVLPTVHDLLTEPHRHHHDPSLSGGVPRNQRPSRGATPRPTTPTILQI
jgi:hypothetical protein